MDQHLEIGETAVSRKPSWVTQIVAVLSTMRPSSDHLLAIGR
jgi:hypothetical protein